MAIHAVKTTDSKSSNITDNVKKSEADRLGASSFADNRSETSIQKKLKMFANNSSNNQVSVQLYSVLNSTIQKQEIEEEELLQGKFKPLQLQENKTGLPDNLKTGIENLSGHTMDDVKVHYNSNEPAKLQAHAFAQGSNIHVGGGQEKHLPHEAWHVVQQKQGRVKPTMQMKGKINVNDDVGLEREADIMGSKANKNSVQLSDINQRKNEDKSIRNSMIQLIQKKSYTKILNKQNHSLKPISPSQNTTIVQRFPAKVLKKPYSSWDAAIGNDIKSSGEGAKGGVYFLKSQMEHPEIQGVVIKPLNGEEGADQSQFGDAFLEAMGINVPTSRIIQKSNSEFAAIANAGVKAKYNEKAEENDFDEDVVAFKLMGQAPGPSLSSISKNMVTQEDVDRLKGLINRQTLNKVAKMVVADAAIGNDDRLALQAAAPQVNLGNIIAGADGNLWAIDTASFLKSLENYDTPMAKSIRVNEIQLVKLADTANIDLLLDSFLDAIVESAKNPSTPPNADVIPSPATQIEQHIQHFRNDAKGYFKVEIQSAFANLHTLMQGKDETSKEKRSKLREESNKTYEEGVGKDLASWQNLKAKYEAYKAVTGAMVNEGDHVNAADPAIKGYLARKDTRITPVARRVLKFGERNNLLTSQQILEINKELVKLSADEQGTLVHLRAGKQKRGQELLSLLGGKNRKQLVDKRLDTARVFLLLKYTEDSDLAAAQSRASALQTSGIGDFTNNRALGSFTALGVPNPGDYFP